MHKKDSEIVKYQHNLTDNDGFVRSTWIEKMNGGGLKFPKDSFVNDMKLWELEFEKFHEPSADGLLRCEGVTKKLIEKLSNMYQNYPPQLFKKFVMAKTMHRMRWIQQRDKNAKETTRESLRSKTKRLAFQY